MKIKDLKVGDNVFIKLGMQHGTKYGWYTYVYNMGNGVKQIKNIYNDKSFGVIDGFGYVYTSEMVDWEKTEELNKAKYNHDFVHNPSHYGGGGKHDIECYKAIEYILDKLENVPDKYYGHVSNIVKYIWRCNYKNGYEDLDKASVYLDFMFREED